MHRAHDLLWPTDPGALIVDGPWPAWATPQWLAVAPAVVRRATSTAGDQVPLGLRGRARHERCAAWLPIGAVRQAQSPESVVEDWLRRGAPRAPGLPCLQALAELAPRLNGLPLDWGVSGSVGFTLASGSDVLRFASDLDLLVRAPKPSDRAALHAIAALLGQAVARVDVQVEAAHGAFALNEWLRTGGPVLLKTSQGPRLVDDPWQQSAPSPRATLA